MSPKFSIDGLDLQKLLTGVWIGFAGIAITVLTMLAGVSYHLSFGAVDLTPIVTMLVSTLCSFVVNFLRKYITDNTPKV